MLWLRKGFINISVTFTHTPWCIYCCGNGLYVPYWRASQAWEWRECQTLLHCKHWHCCGRQKRKEEGGNYRKEMHGYKGSCEWWGDSWDSNTHSPGSTGSSDLLTAQSESVLHLQTGSCPAQEMSTAEISLLKSQAEMLHNYQDAIKPQAEDMIWGCNYTIRDSQITFCAHAHSHIVVSVFQFLELLYNNQCLIQ